jgi:molybdopterin molybdotransferase
MTMPSEMLHPDEALRLVLDDLPAPRLEEVALADALGRALPEAVMARLDQPPFDKSAMDGFAFAASFGAVAEGGAGAGQARVAASGGPWRVVSLVAAGAEAGVPLGPGECARIMTGAPLPEGATAVQRVEWTEAAGSDAEGRELVRFTKPEPVSNVIGRGENQRSGSVLIGPRILGPQDIGILASDGQALVRVARRPVVGVVSTGDELRNPGEELGKAAIYDSNGPALAAQAAAAGAEVRRYGIARDEAGALEALLGRALDDCDIVLVSGGVSMGDFDYVPRTLEKLGVKRVFHKIAMKPGKPTFYGRRGSASVFGLPGNPVSTFVNFEFLVKAQLYRRMGLGYEPRIVAATLAQDLVRRECDRVEFFPMSLDRSAGRGGERALPLAYKGSSMLSILAEADCLVRAEIGTSAIKEGSLVLARLLRP